MKRVIDKLGRLVIPAVYRQAIGVENNEEVNIELQGNKIIVTNAKDDQLTAEDTIQELMKFIDECPYETPSEKELLDNLSSILKKYKK